MTDDTRRPASGKGRPDPQAALLDRLSADAVLHCLGPSWAAMSAAERERYGSAPAQPDPLFDRLAAVAAGDDLLPDIEQDFGSILDRCEAKLIALERRVQQNLYRAARERIAHERGP